jgi:pimeloyl-ACP methyl ester carboxylesterase
VARAHNIDVASAEVQCAADGTAWIEAGHGEPLVLVHGVGMNRAVWAPQMAYFAARGYRVIAYDMLGHGGSPLPPETTRLADLRAQLGALLDELGIERAHLMGHSMGSLVALEFALAAPDRVHDVVALNAVYERSSAQRAAVEDRARRLADGSGDATLEETLDRWFGPEQRARQPECIAAVRHWLDVVDPIGYARVYGCFARADDAFSGRLPELAVPALFITGEHDPNSTPAMSSRMAAESPQGQLEVVAGERHMMAYVEPDSVNPLIERFIRQSEGGQSSDVEAQSS